MTPRNLSLANDAAAPSLTLADGDCIAASDAAVAAWLESCAAMGSLLSVRQPANRYTNADGTVGVSRDSYFGEAAWLARAVVAWGHARGNMSGRRRAIVDGWLCADAEWLAAFMDGQLSALWPNRAADDYIVRAGAAVAANPYSTKRLYAGGRLIPHTAMYYNNRRATMAFFVGLAGLTFDDAALIECAKRYMREWVMFGVFPDGEQGEWERADDYGIPAAGVTYGCMNVGAAMEMAARLAERGDTSLRDFWTVDGAHGTQSAVRKTVFTAFDCYVDMLDGVRSVTTPAGNAVDLYSTSAGRPMHWHYLLAPARSMGRAQRLSRQLDVATPQGVNQDFGMLPWSGFCGIYKDVRT